MFHTKAFDDVMTSEYLKSLIWLSQEKTSKNVVDTTFKVILTISLVLQILQWYFLIDLVLRLHPAAFNLFILFILCQLKEE